MQYFSNSNNNNPDSLSDIKQTQTSSENIDSKQEIQRLGSIITLRESVQPLDQNFFLKILHLEEKIIFDDNYTKESVEQIIELYAKCVEHYDSVKDPISFYFLEKIQMTLASSETLRIMHEKKRRIKESISRFDSLNSSQLNLMVQKNSSNFEDEELWDLGNSQLYNKLQHNNSSSNSSQATLSFGRSSHLNKKQTYKNAVKNDKDQRYSISKKKKERARKVELYQEQVNFMKQNDTRIIFKQQEINQQRIQDTIQNDLQSQTDRIQDRINLRKYQKQLSKSRKKQQEQQQYDQGQVGEIKVFETYDDENNKNNDSQLINSKITNESPTKQQKGLLGEQFYKSQEDQNIQENISNIGSELDLEDNQRVSIIEQKNSQQLLEEKPNLIVDQFQNIDIKEEDLNQ